MSLIENNLSKPLRKHEIPLITFFLLSPKVPLSVDLWLVKEDSGLDHDDKIYRKETNVPTLPL